MSEPATKLTTALSESTPPALPAHAVTLLLSYLSPLESPLPPHLLSEPLQQRHHYLALGSTFDSAEDAAAYISWPSPGAEDDSSHYVAKLLGDLPPPDSFDPMLAYPTRYSYDGETIYAHCHVFIDPSSNSDNNGLRLIFRWEAGQAEGFVRGHDGRATNAEGWKFHDAKPMPFPLGVFDTQQDALDSIRAASGIRPATTAESRGLSAPGRNGTHDEVLKADDEDAYWNSYGQSSSTDDFESQGYAQTSGSRNDQSTEDAYWARYASVHGKVS